MNNYLKIICCLLLVCNFAYSQEKKKKVVKPVYIGPIYLGERKDTLSIFKPDTAKNLILETMKYNLTNLLKNIDTIKRVNDVEKKVCLPLKNIRLTSLYGVRLHPILKVYKYHSGIDLSARTDFVYAVMEGRIKTVGYNDLIGNYVFLNCGAMEFGYGHLSIINVKIGDTVKCGDILGITGNTGLSTGEHLHFIVRYENMNLDPVAFLKELLAKLSYD